MVIHDMISMTLSVLDMIIVNYLHLWCHRHWFWKFTVCFRPFRKEIMSSKYNKFNNWSSQCFLSQVSISYNIARSKHPWLTLQDRKPVFRLIHVTKVESQNALARFNFTTNAISEVFYFFVEILGLFQLHNCPLKRIFISRQSHLTVRVSDLDKNITSKFFMEKYKVVDFHNTTTQNPMSCHKHVCYTLD